MKITGVVFAVVLNLVLVSYTNAQDKVPVAVVGSPSDDDDAGRQFVFEIKEAIRSSHAFRVVDERVYPQLRVGVSTDKTSGGTAAAITYVYDSLDTPMRGVYITAAVQTCGTQRVQSCARS